MVAYLAANWTWVSGLLRREAARVEPDLDMKEFEPDSSGPKDPAEDSSYE